MFAEFREGLIRGSLTSAQFDELIAWWQSTRATGEGLPAFLVRQGVLTREGGVTVERAMRGDTPADAAGALLAPIVQARWPTKSTARALAPGEPFGLYRLIDQVGRGPRATVFTAEDTRTGHTRAIKVFNRPGRRGAEAPPPPVGFSHPNCLPILESGTESGLAYVVMPYAEGGSADAAVGRRGSMPPAQAARVCRLAAQGLAGAHAAGVPHGNLKLTNLLFGPAGEVWLSDFGPPPAAGRPLSAAFRADLRAFALIIARLVTNQSVPDVPIVGSLPRFLTGVPAPFGAVVAALAVDPPAPPCATAGQLVGELAAAEATVVAATHSTVPGPVRAPAPPPAPPELDPNLTPVVAAGAEPAAPVGRMLGKCLLICQIGQGGAGVVYRAEHQTLNIDVAVKVLRADSADPDVRKGLRREARLLARLNHPNVVRLWDFDEASAPPYLVMEYVEGATLAELITLEGAMEAARALALVEQVGRGLAAACELGIVHRDVKPANVLVTPGGQAKLTDLGLALMINSRLSSLARPAVAGLAGTIAYLAPEQAVAADTADHRADIYSLGSTFYHLVTGRVPFPALTVRDVLRKHASEPPRPPHEVAPGVPKVVSPIILRMLAKDPRDRQQTYAELFAEFQSLRDALESSRLQKSESDIELPDDPSADPTRPGPQRPAGWWRRLFGGRPGD
jgi:serine/threonine protein kinase